MKAAARSAALLLLAASVSACGAQSQFTRRNARASEIVWRVNGALQATKGGRVVAEGRSFSGLDEAVSCVPMARERAASRVRR